MSPEIDHLIQIVGVGVATMSAIIGFLMLLHKKVMIPLVFMFDGYKRLIDKVDNIFLELQSNDGKSLKDRVLQIHDNVKLLDARHKAVLSNTEEGHFETDSEGNNIWSNRTLIKALQCLPYELAGHGWQNFVHPDDRRKIVDLWYKSVSESTEITLRFNMISTENETIPVLLRSYKLIDSKGELLGYFGTIHFLKDGTLS